MQAAQPKSCLCPKEVATLLGISERGAVRLMSSGEIASFRVGKPWRTFPEHVTAYQFRCLDRFRRRPAA